MAPRNFHRDLPARSANGVAPAGRPVAHVLFHLDDFKEPSFAMLARPIA